jgi:hypothetical protein
MGAEQPGSQLAEGAYEGVYLGPGEQPGPQADVCRKSAMANETFKALTCMRILGFKPQSQKDMMQQCEANRSDERSTCRGYGFEAESKRHDICVNARSRQNRRKARAKHNSFAFATQ